MRPAKIWFQDLVVIFTATLTLGTLSFSGFKKRPQIIPTGSARLQMRLQSWIWESAPDFYLRKQAYAFALCFAVLTLYAISQLVEVRIPEKLNLTSGTCCATDSQDIDTWKGAAVAALVAFPLGNSAMVMISDVVSRVFTPMVDPHRIERSSRLYPRLMPALTGLAERILFTPIFVILFKPDLLSLLGIVGVAGAYLTIRTFRIDRGDFAGESKTSLHAFWNITANLGFAVAGGWAFWQAGFYG